MITESYLYELMGAINNYYSQPVFSSQEWIELWKEGLPEELSIYRQATPSEVCSLMNYRRFFLEMNDIGLDEFLKQSVSAPAYQSWNQQQQASVLGLPG